MTLIAAERPLTHGNTHGQQRGEETAFKPCRALVPHRRGGSHHARPAKGRTIRDAPRRRRAELGPVLPRSCGSSAAGLEGCCLELGCPPQPSPAAVCPPCTAPCPYTTPSPHIRSVSNIHRCNHCNTDAGCRLSSLFTVQQVTGDNISVVTAITQTSPQHSR